MRIVNLIWGFSLGAGIDKCYLTYADLASVDTDIIIKNVCINVQSRNSYYVCNRKPGDGLIAPLRSIVFFRIEKRDEPLRYASRTLASLNAMKGGSGKKKSKKLAR